MSKNVFHLEDFNFDNEAKKIISCPMGNVCIESEFISSKRYYYARFVSEQCASCNVLKQCPVKIKNKFSTAKICKNVGKATEVISIPIYKDEKSQQQIYEDMLNEGVKLKRQGRYEEAKNKYIEAIKMEYKTSTAYYNLGKILYILGDFEASAISYKTAFELLRGPYFELGAGTYNILLNLGHALLDKGFRSGKYESAISFYEKSMNPHLIKDYIGSKDNLINTPQDQLFTELKCEYDNKCIDAAKKYLNI